MGEIAPFLKTHKSIAIGDEWEGIGTWDKKSPSNYFRFKIY